MAERSPFADDSHHPDNSGFGDQFQTPQFLQRLTEWSLWTKIFGWTLIGVGGLTIVTAVLSLLTKLSELGPRTSWAMGMVLMLFIVFVAFFLPGIFILQSGRKTSSYLRTDDPEELVDGFRALHSFWRTIGILAGIMVALMCLAIPLLLTVFLRPMQ
jgi:Na+/proline symporter